jgi:rhodanese-related sulfurtransferase
MNMINKKFVGCFVAVIMLLSFAATAQPLTAQNNYTNITPKQANQMIKSYPSSNIVILDVRNESECKFAHLYNAFNLPVYVLDKGIDHYVALPGATLVDYRVAELMKHVNDPIIVYCEKGSRSAEAASILAEKGFTQVYNIIGGIDAWIQADLPFYNTAHNITVSQTKTTIEPLTSFPCACENFIDPSEKAVVTNQVLDMIEETENFSHATFSFEYADTTYDSDVSVTTLWTYENSDRYSNVTAFFELLNSSGDVSTYEYVLNYKVEHIDYNFSVATILQPLDANTYNVSGTIVRFAPTGKEDWLSRENVVFTSPVTLTKLYAELGKICKDLAQTYKKEGSKNNDAVLTDLAVNYGHMADGLKDLSKLVHKELRSYDLEILQSQAVLLDDCTICLLVCNIILDLLITAPSSPIMATAVCIAAGIGTAGVGGIACGLIATAVIGGIMAFSMNEAASAICSAMGYCGPTYVDYCYTWPYFNGYVVNHNYIYGTPDGLGADFYGHAYNDGANMVCRLSQMSSGFMMIWVKPTEPTMFHVYVGVKGDNDWRFVYSQLQQPTGGWYAIYTGNSDPYQYVGIAAWDPQHCVEISVDAIKANI